MRPCAKFGALLVAAAVVAGCTGVPDRESQALDIEQRIAAMPGVSDVDLIYDNGVLEGTRFELSVDMVSATEEQIGAVAIEIDAMRGDDFAEHDQRVEIDIADGVSMGLPKLRPENSGFVAGLLRELDSRITAQSIELLRTSQDTTRIDIHDAVATGTVLDTVLQVFTEQPIDQIEINPPPGPNREASWWIRTRITPQAKRDIDARLAAAAPAAPRLIVFGDGRIVQLNVAIPSPETAYDDVVHVIDVLGAGPQRPLKLLWSWNDDPARYGDLRWSGSVDIGDCDGPNANTGSPDDLVPAAKQLQQRIRDQYGPCRK